MVSPSNLWATWRWTRFTDQTAVTWTDQVVAPSWWGDRWRHPRPSTMQWTTMTWTNRRLWRPSDIYHPLVPEWIYSEQGTVTDIGTRHTQRRSQSRAYRWTHRMGIHPCIVCGKTGFFTILKTIILDPWKLQPGAGYHDNDNIVGFAHMNYSTVEEPIIWIDHEPIRIIESHSRIQGYATAINEQDEVVGFILT